MNQQDGLKIWSGIERKERNRFTLTTRKLWSLRSQIGVCKDKDNQLVKVLNKLIRDAWKNGYELGNNDRFVIVSHTIRK